MGVREQKRLNTADLETNSDLVMSDDSMVVD
jgi:hypothetical protein